MLGPFGVALAWLASQSPRLHVSRLLVPSPSFLLVPSPSFLLLPCLLTPEFADPPPPSHSDQTLSDTPIAAPSSLGPDAPAVVLPDVLPDSLLGFAHLVLETPEPGLKCALTREAVSRMRAGKLKSIRPSLGEVKRVRKEVGLLEKPPRLQEAVRPWQTSKR